MKTEGSVHGWPRTRVGRSAECLSLLPLPLRRRCPLIKVEAPWMRMVESFFAMNVRVRIQRLAAPAVIRCPGGKVDEKGGFGG